MAGSRIPQREDKLVSYATTVLILRGGWTNGEGAMPLYEIEHKWTNEQTKTVVEKVQNAIQMAKKGQVPQGFRPVAIVAIPGKTEAHCLWEAPSVEALDGVYKSLGLPTTRTIREVTPFYTA